MKRLSSLILAVLTMVGATFAIGTSPAHAVTYCPGVDYYLNNNWTSQTCLFRGPPNTLENLAPTIILRGYGMCVITGHRWDGFWNQYWNTAAGHVEGAVRVVQDNGYCTGPTIPMYVRLQLQPYWRDPSTGDIQALWGCTRRAESFSGAVASVMERQDPGLCMMRTPTPYYLPGKYIMGVTIRTQFVTEWAGLYGHDVI